LKDSFHSIFNEINLLHIGLITTISVFFKEFLYFLFEYFEDFKLKDSIGKSNSKGSITENIPSILNHDNGSSNKPEDSSSGTQASGSGAQASGSGTQASGSGAQASDLEDKSIAEDWRNYQYDSDSDFDYNTWKQEDDTKSENEEDYNTGIGDGKAQFEAKIAKMEDSEAIRDLKTVLSTAKQMYELSPHVPAAKTQIPLLEEKIAMCESRISDLEAENSNQSKDKGKGKAN
jgi:hypothetical protein